MRVEKRVRALEARYIKDPVVLYFADGSTAEVCGHGDFLLRLLAAAAWGGDLSPGQQEQLDLIRASVDSVEPDGGPSVITAKPAICDHFKTGQRSRGQDMKLFYRAGAGSGKFCFGLP